MTKSTSINTLGALLEGKYKVYAYCEEPLCRHYAILDLKALAAKFGPDQPAMHHDLVRMLYCPKCGSKNLSFRLHPNVDQKYGAIGPWERD